MAVPYKPINEVLPDRAQPAYQSGAGATPEAFGAGVGRAIGAFGAEMADYAQTLHVEKLRRATLTNEMLVTDATTALSRRFIEEQSNYTQNSRGRQAQERLPSYNQRLNELYQEQLDAMPSPNTRASFANAGQGLVTAAMSNGVTHANTEFNSWEKESAEGYAGQMAQQALLATDPLDRIAAIRGGANRLRDYNISQGMAPDMVSAEEADYKGRAYFAIISQMVNNGDLTGAVTTFDQAREEMSAQFIVETSNMLQGPLATAERDRIVRSATSWTDRSRLLITQAVIEPNNPRRLAQIITEGETAIRAQRFKVVDGRQIPLTADEVEADVATFRGEVFEGAIDSLLANGQTQEALTLFRQAMPLMDSEAIGNVQTALKEPLENARARNAAALAIRGQPIAPALQAPAQLNILSQVNPSLADVTLRAAQLAQQDGFAFQFPLTHSAGLRGEAEQRDLVARGWSQTMNSRHLHGEALDIVPLRNGQPDPNWDEGYDRVRDYMAQAAQELGVGIEWGGDWQTFVDKPHFQLSGQQALDVPYKELFVAAGQRYNVDPALLANIARAESSFNASAVSPRGATGVMQLMPGTAAELGVDPNDPMQNIDGGAKYFRQMLDKYGGDTNLALMAYNWGPGNVDNWLEGGSDLGQVPQETREYVEKVLGGRGMSGLPRNQGGGRNAEMPAPTYPAGMELFQHLTSGPNQEFSEVAPINLAMPDRDVAINRVIESMPEGAERDRTLSKLNQGYELRNSRIAGERAALVARAEQMIELASRGDDVGQFPEAQIRTLLETTPAQELVTRYLIAEQVGNVINAVEFSRPEDITALRTNLSGGMLNTMIEEQLAGRGVGALDVVKIQTEALNLFDQQMRQRQAMLFGENADPATYAAGEPSVAEAWATFQAQVNPENWQNYVEKTLAVQERLGLAPEDRRVLNRERAQALTQNLLDGRTDAATFFRQQMAEQGPYFEQFLSDLQSLGELPAAFAFTALIPPRSADLLSRALREQATSGENKDILQEAFNMFGGDGGVSNSALLDRNLSGAQPALRNYLTAMSHVLPADQLNEIFSAVRTLSMAEVVYTSNKDLTTAANNAAEAFTGKFDYMYQGGVATAVLPIESAPTIRRRVARFEDSLIPAPTDLIPGEDLSPFAIQIPDLGVLNQLGMPTSQDYIRMLRSEGLWITNPMSTGLNLIDPSNAIVLRPDGTPFEVPFEDTPLDTILNQTSTSFSQPFPANRGVVEMTQPDQVGTRLGMPEFDNLQTPPAWAPPELSQNWSGLSDEDKRAIIADRANWEANPLPPKTDEEGGQSLLYRFRDAFDMRTGVD